MTLCAVLFLRFFYLLSARHTAQKLLLLVGGVGAVLVTTGKPESAELMSCM